MIEMGILDPTKVRRLALQNAASVAGLFLTTEASITEAPKESHSPAAQSSSSVSQESCESWFATSCVALLALGYRTAGFTVLRNNGDPVNLLIESAGRCDS